jgi:tripartite-type tricarboxylate transporter receptor subunit TctC
VPYTPGTGADILARLLGPRLGERWKVAVITENKAGATGNIGAEFVAKAVPDGHTLLFVATSFGTTPALARSLPFDPVQSFAPVVLVATSGLVVVVNPQLPVRSMRELIEAAKREPGKLHYSSPGNGGPQHLAMELLKSELGINLVHVPYKGTGPALTAMLGGEIQVQLIGISSVVPHMKSGRMRALAVSGAKRSAAAPDVPTVAESGVPGYAFDVWYGMLFPAGTPRAIVGRANAEINNVLKSPALAQRFAAVGLEPAGSTPEEFAKMIRSEMAKWRKVVREAKIQVQ